jgi:DNA-binding MarR family transcriptional regulator
VDRLTAKELVSVRGDTADGRAQILTLRASGRRLVPKIAALADENERESFGHLSPIERASLLAMVRGLAQTLGLRGAPVD